MIKSFICSECKDPCTMQFKALLLSTKPRSCPFGHEGVKWKEITDKKEIYNDKT